MDKYKTNKVKDLLDYEKENKKNRNKLKAQLARPALKA